MEQDSNQGWKISHFYIIET